MRPLMSTFLESARDEVEHGRYDDVRAITVDAGGNPIVRHAPAETMTRVVNEPADDERAWALETITKVVNEPADDERAWTVAMLELAHLGVDDPATGLVSF